ncbi:MAG: hypothetical protein H7Z43_00940 [Clostridia bacterium]|nr:hypothetical protein [Deltaproteobacteria bacterium]
MCRPFVLYLVAGLSACGGGPVPAPPTVSPDGAAAVPVTLAHPAPQASVNAATAWAGRIDRFSVAKAIDGYKRETEITPGDPAPLIALARAYVFFADNHLRTTADRAARSDALESAMDTSEKGLLASSPAFAAAVEAGQPIDKAIDACDASAAPALAAYGTALARYGLDKGFTALLMYKARIIAAMQRVLAVAPDTQYAAADRELGSFYACTPSFAGGDLAKSRMHFDKAIERAPQALETRLRYAETYAVASHDRALFAHLLQEIQDADAGASEIYPDNYLVKKRAALLALSINELFLP